MDRVSERTLLVALRRQRMQDMLDGKTALPHGWNMLVWKRASCGTEACAVGNYTSLPDSEGLAIASVKERGWPALGQTVINLETGALGIRATAQHFAISDDLAEDCFLANIMDNYTRSDVAAVFRQACAASPLVQLV